jgi:D-glycero-alpha-D-manno-heptose-7-phosphate kinase
VYTERRAVIVKTPLRVSLGGGGTDLPFYASCRGGFLITGAIDEYISVSVAVRPLDDQILVQTTSTQFASTLDELENDVIRAVLQYFEISGGIQVATFSTLPTGIGLGSSSAQIVGLVKALSTLLGQDMSPHELGEVAHRIEREILGWAGGIQDQYISAIGGVQVLTVDTDGAVRADPLVVADEIREDLERRLVLISANVERNSADIIKSQMVDIDGKLAIYDGIKEIGRRSAELLKRGDIVGLGEAMDEHWRLKKRLSDQMSNNAMDGQYEELKALGSPGGKIVGAGGGGFFMMAVPGDLDTYVKELYRRGYRALDWSFDFEGSHVIDQSPPNGG